MTRESTNDGAASGGVPEAGAPPSRRGWPIFERERETPIAYLARSPSVSKCDCSSQGCRLHVLPKTLSSQVTLSFFAETSLMLGFWLVLCRVKMVSLLWAAAVSLRDSIFTFEILGNTSVW